MDPLGFEKINPAYQNGTQTQAGRERAPPRLKPAPQLCGDVVSVRELQAPLDVVHMPFVGRPIAIDVAGGGG